MVIISSLIIEKKIKNILIVKIHNLKKIGFIPRSILNYSMPLLFSGALVLVFNKADIFMLGIFTSESSVGIYNFILTIATLLTIFLVSINQIFFPVISHLHAEKNINALTRVFKIALRWDFLLTFPLFIFLIVFSKPLLESFFPAYTSGWKALVILSIGMMFHTGLGPVGHTLETFGKTMFIFKLNSILVVINIILNYFLIPYYGIEGAAFATATAFSLNNIFEMWKVRKLITFKINFKTYIKYILSAIIPILIFYFIIESLLYNWFILIIVFIFSIILYITILSILRSFLIEDLYLIEIFDCIFTKIGFKKKYFKNFFRRFVK